MRRQSGCLCDFVVLLLFFLSKFNELELTVLAFSSPVQDRSDGGIPDVLTILQTERPFASDEVLETMCRKYPLLRDGKTFNIIGGKKKKEEDPEPGTFTDSRVGGDDGFDGANDGEGEDPFAPERTNQRYRVYPKTLQPKEIKETVSQLIQCGFDDDDICRILAADPTLVGQKNVKSNFDTLLEAGLTEEWLLRIGLEFPTAFHRDIPRKLDLLRSMGFKGRDELLHQLRKTRLRILSYDVGRKIAELRDMGFTDGDVKRLCRSGPNVFGMDLRKRFRRLEEVGFRDVVKLVRRYPQVLALRTKTIEQFVEAGLGLSFEDVVVMAEKCPSILGLNSTRALEALEGLNPGASRKTVGKLVKAFPQALTYDIEKRVDDLATLLRMHDEAADDKSPSQLNNESRIILGKMFARYPPILGYKLDSRLALLNEAGIPSPQALRAMKTFPQLVSYDAESRMQKLAQTGLCPPVCTPEQLGKMIGSFPALIGYDLEKKMQDMVTHLGFNRTQALEMVVNYPRIVGVGVETTAKPAAEFFLSRNKNVTLDYLAKHPRVLTRSVERCLKPRADRLEELGREWMPTTLVSLSDRSFEERYGCLGEDK